MKKQYFYFYWSNILLYVSVLLLKYLICVLCPPLVIYNSTVHGADLTYISLLIIFYIIVYVTNTILNLEKQTSVTVWRCSRANSMGDWQMCESTWKHILRLYRYILPSRVCLSWEVHGYKIKTASSHSACATSVLS